MSFYSDFAEHYEAVFPFREPVLRFLVSHLAVPSPPTGGRRRILDIGCGTGHYCGRLAAAGHKAIGIDLDPAMIAAASRSYPVAAFHCLDMLDLDRLPPPFDLVYCIGNVLPHLPRERLPELIGKVAAALAPGGVWIFQTVNWDHVLARAVARPATTCAGATDPVSAYAGHGATGSDATCAGTTDATAHEAETYRFPDRTLLGGVVFRREYRDITPERLRFCTRLATPDRVIFAGEVDLYPVRAQEHRRLHEAAGFSLAGHWGDFAGAPFAPDVEGGSVFVFRRKS
jgi:SAM-dependent methyltransferase